MTKPKRRLESRGSYDVPVDNVYVVRPDTVDRVVPNLIYGQNNRNFYNVGAGYNMHGQFIDYNNNGALITKEEAKRRIKESYVPERKIAAEQALRDIALDAYRAEHKYKEGGIHIAPSKKGTFTAAATKHGMGVQEFAARVLRNKNNYSPSLVKKANFARNASKWNH